MTVAGVGGGGAGRCRWQPTNPVEAISKDAASNIDDLLKANVSGADSMLLNHLMTSFVGSHPLEHERCFIDEGERAITLVLAARRKPAE